MKIICKKSNLLNGVQIVSKAVSNKTTMPILECILVDATKGIIKLTANDMDLGIETIIEGDIAEGGIIAIEAKLFLEMIRKLPDNDVVIEVNDDVIDNPELINEDPYTNWIFKLELSDASEVDNLLSKEDYESDWDKLAKAIMGECV